MATDQWASARPLFAKADLPHVLAAEDKDRLKAYSLYENIYRNVPQTYALQQYGQDSAPIYLPSPKKMIEATNRFLAVDWNYLVDPALGSPEEQKVLGGLMSQLWRRERMVSKFNTQKRYGLVRADAVWHVLGNPNKPAGRRISIKEVHPEGYFPILDPEDKERIIGVHLVDIVKDPSEAAKDPNTKKTAVRRQTYRKVETPTATTITSECAIFETDAWDDRVLLPKDIKKIAEVAPVIRLDPRITAIPVYHIANKRMPGSMWGDSQLAGIERIFAAANQSISDEELTLVTQGLGMFYSTSGPPINAADGSTGSWDLGPGQMIEIGPEDKVGRLTGVTTVAPMLDHIRFLLDEASASLGLSDVATGRVDVTVAESGISLFLQLAPLLAATKEQEDEMLPVYDNMWFDLKTGWFPAYEATDAETVAEVTTYVGDPMPVNKDAEILRITNLVTAKLMSIDEARALLSGLGIELDDGTNAAGILAEAAALSKAQFGDPFANRYDTEQDDPENTGTGG